MLDADWTDASRGRVGSRLNKQTFLAFRLDEAGRWCDLLLHVLALPEEGPLDPDARRVLRLRQPTEIRVYPHRDLTPAPIEPAIPLADLDAFESTRLELDTGRGGSTEREARTVRLSGSRPTSREISSTEASRDQMPVAVLTNAHSLDRARCPIGCDAVIGPGGGVAVLRNDAATRCQVHLDVTATRAGIRARVPAVGGDELAAVPARLVREQTTQVGEAGVGDRLRQRPVRKHPGDVEVLDGQPGQTRRELSSATRPRG